MNFRKYLSLLLSVSIFSQSASPIFAVDLGEEGYQIPLNQTASSSNSSSVSSSSRVSPKRLISTIQELEEKIAFISGYRSVPAPLTFWGAPGKTAAGILHFARHKGEIYIFLGEREDTQGSWCNLGGGSDAKEGALEEQESDPHQKKNDFSDAAPTGEPEQNMATTLDADAARESTEESNGIYTLHHRRLKKQPFIDTYDPNSKMYYRMYWQMVQYIEPYVFQEKLNDAAANHNKEYTKFNWFKAADLLEAVTDSRHPLRGCIYGPLFNTLSTDSAITFLRALSVSKKLNPFQSEIRRLRNRLYIIGNTAHQHDEQPITWPTVPVDGKDALMINIKEGRHNLFNSNQELQKNRLALAHLPPQDLPGALNELTFQPSTHPVIPVSAPAEKDQLDEAVAAHGMAMVLMKSRLKREGLLPQPQIVPVATPPWNPDCTETLSRIHLRIVLGPDYKEADYFAGDPKPQRAADIANMQLYFSRFSQGEMGNKKEEFKRMITPEDSDYQFLADVLEWETAGRMWPTSFHGASAKVNNLITAFTYQRRLFDMDDHNGSMFLRGTDIYFNGIENLRDLIEKEGVGESDRNRAAMLFMNFVLFAGLQTTRSTSSSVEYVLNDHSVNEVDVGERYEEAAALSGFSKPDYAPLGSIHEQFKGNKDRKRGNSVLLAIRQNPENFDDYNYPTDGGGRFWHPQGLGSMGMPSSTAILHGLQKEYERQRTLREPEPFKIDMDKKRDLIPENRGYLDPRRMKDSTQIHIKSFDRFKLTAAEDQEYSREMTATTAAIGADWLSARAQILDGAFVTFPKLKTLHRLVVGGVTGEPLQEAPSAAGFIHLIRHGQLNGVKQFLQSFPKILTYGTLAPKKLLAAAIEGQNPDLIQFLAEDILKTNVQKILGLEDYYTNIRKILMGGVGHKILPFMLEQFDPKTILDDVKRIWVNLAHTPESRKDLIEYISKTTPHLLKTAFKDILRLQYVGGDEYNNFLDMKIINPQELLSMVFERMIENKGKKYANTETLISTCFERGADLRAEHPLTGESMLFLLPEIKCFFPEEIKMWIQSNIEEVLGFLNKQGLSLLQVTQKTLLENGSRFLALLAPSIHEERYKEKSYPPFLEYFGPTKSFPHDAGHILGAPESIQWVRQLQNVTTRQEAESLMDTCPDGDLLDCFYGKLQEFQVQGIYLKKVSLDGSKQRWIDNVKDALSDKETLKNLLIQAPSSHLRQVLYLLLDREHVDILPSVLQKAYPSRESLMNDDTTLLQTAHKLTSSDLYEEAPPEVVDCFLNFLDDGGRWQFFLKLSGYERFLCHKVLSEKDLFRIYNAVPSFFTGMSIDDEDMFEDSLNGADTPFSLTQRIIMDHLPRLKELHMRSGMPYFWLFLLAGDESLPLIRELVSGDRSLLQLKSVEGLTLHHLLAMLPQADPYVRSLKRLLASDENPINRAGDSKAQ